VMTKQHFEAIAQIIRETTYIDPHKFESYIKKEDFIQKLGRYFKDQNPNFCPDRFAESCEM